jgi:hypothetical protein
MADCPVDSGDRRGVVPGFPRRPGYRRLQGHRDASACQQVKQGEWASNLELPCWKEEGTVSVQNLQGRFAGIVNLSKRAFGSMEVLSDDLIGQAGRFIGKRGCRGSPAGGDRIAGSEFPSLVETSQIKHVPVSKKLKRKPGPRSKAVESLPFRMKWATQL